MITEVMTQDISSYPFLSLYGHYYFPAAVILTGYGDFPTAVATAAN